MYLFTRVLIYTFIFHNILLSYIFFIHTYYNFEFLNTNFVNAYLLFKLMNFTVYLLHILMIFTAYYMAYFDTF